MGLNLASRAFNLAVAAFAGASMAFAAFALPADMFGELVAASGLPLLLSAAEPPLGATARLVAMIGGGGAMFALAWLLLGFIDRLAALAPAPADDDFFDLEFDPPRLRRADAHPDAPSRHPLRARRELGEPAEAREPAPHADDDASDRQPAVEPPPLPDALPAFLVEAGTSDGDLPAAAVAEAAEPVEAGTGPAEAVAEPAGDSVIEPLELAGFEEATEAAASVEEPASEPIEASGSDEVAEPVEPPAPEPFAEPLDLVDVVEDAPIADSPTSEPAELEVEEHEDTGHEIPVARIHPPEDRGESISGLLERLDNGYADSEWPLGQNGAEPPLRQLDDRLRNAIDQLQKMASRNGG
jgi:hypothetical protein